MKVMICIGSSCHIRGSYDVVNKLKSLVDNNTSVEHVDLCGSFCMGECGKGVCIKVDEKKYVVEKENIEEFYLEHIKK